MASRPFALRSLTDAYRAPAHRLAAVLALAALATSCARGGPPPAEPPAPAPAVRPPPPVRPPATQPPERPRPVAPPEIAFQLDLMPLASTGVAAFRALHPTIDGRGVLIAILDTGIDLGVPGLQATTTGAPKVLDLRNFSGEGDVALAPVTADAAGRIALPGGLGVGGAATVRAAAVGPEWFGGVLAELPFGALPASDFNGNGGNRDSYGVVVVRGPSGWLAFVDTNGDGTLADETALADFLVRRETLTFSSQLVSRGHGPITGALNLADDPAHPGRPVLSFILDTSAHGTHIAGVAAGHDLYGVPGFDGVAPGAQLLGLKMSDNARGGISTTGSMIRALEYAARFAAERGLPLVVNLSFGIGNEIEGGAAMDSLVDAFLLRHPDVVFTISAGNDGPGTSTVGLPASAELALAVGAVYPGAFARVQFGVESRDILGWWGARGGELAKPDLVTPGMAYSTVPAWSSGREILLGTSQAAPYAAGLAALLVSANLQERRPTRAAQVIQALRASGRHLEGATQIDQGFGVPQMEAAYRWLAAGHEAPRLRVQALSAAPPPPPGVMRGPDVAAIGRGPVRTGAYRRDGLASPADTIQRFRIAALPPAAGGSAAAGESFRLVSDAPWVSLGAPTATLDQNGAALVEVRYDASQLTQPGRYVGTVFGHSASDSASGPLFALPNTVIVTDTAAALAARSRKVPGGAAARFFLRVPAQGAGLAVRAVTRDSLVPGVLSLYEPSGRPSRATEALNLGGDGPAHVSAVLSVNDAVPGVWELVMQSLPGRELRYDVEARVPGARIAGVDSNSAMPRVTFSAVSTADTVLTVTAEQLGITRLQDVAIVNGTPVRDTLEPPSWANALVVEVSIPRSQWSAVTDFSMIAYDRDGAQLGQGAMNYDFHRFRVELPERRAGPFPVRVELFPAFAHEGAPARYDVRMRVTFVGVARPLQVSAGRDVTAGSDSASVRIPGGGTASVTIGALRPLPPAPGWDEWIRVRAVDRRTDWVVLERYIAVHRAP